MKWEVIAKEGTGAYDDIWYLNTHDFSDLNFQAEIVPEAKNRFRVGFFLNDGLMLKKFKKYKTLKEAKKICAAYTRARIKGQIKLLQKFLVAK
jgi:hypothetical protein